jgi:hypothetical protein
MFGALRRGERPSTTNLSKDQKNLVEEIWRGKSPEIYVKYKKQFANIKSLTDFQNKIKSLGI